MSKPMDKYLDIPLASKIIQLLTLVKFTINRNFILLILKFN